MKEEDKPIKVYLVNPPSENPWRTQEDYCREQRRETIRFWITIASFADRFLRELDDIGNIAFIVLVEFITPGFCWQRLIAREPIEIPREVDCSWRAATLALS